MRKLVGAIVVVCALLLASETSLACTVIAWNFEELAHQAEGLVRGRVVRVEQGGRVAVLAVSDYLGPGTVPRELRVGPTENSSGPAELVINGQRMMAAGRCPDQSVVFHRGQEYVVLLRGEGQAVRLADPQGKTAVPVDAQGMIQVRGDSEQKRPAQAFMLEFSVRHRLVDWGGGWGWGWVWFVGAGLGAVGLGAGLLAWRRGRRAG